MKTCRRFGGGGSNGRDRLGLCQDVAGVVVRLYRRYFLVWWCVQVRVVVGGGGLDGPEWAG
jgi:hypothetical protein